MVLSLLSGIIKQEERRESAKEKIGLLEQQQPSLPTNSITEQVMRANSTQKVLANFSILE